MRVVRAWIGLGSNLEQPLEQIGKALGALARLPRSRLVARSSLYRSAPLGPSGQPDYVNAVAELETGLEPAALLDRLHTIEQAQGRVRGPVRWTARTLDLDLLLYGDAVIETPTLSVPHPGLPLRPFVLVPLAEIAPRLRLPDGQSVAELAAACPRDGLALIG